MSSATASIVNLVASILAAAATVVLAVFAIRQWCAMKENNEAAERQNELVRDRWKREDELRAEENRPKAVFWVNPTQNNEGIELWCANLGSVAFLVSAMVVDRIQSSNPIRCPIGEVDQSVVQVGTKWSCVLRANTIVCSPLYAKADIRLTLTGPSGETMTDAKAYSLNFLSQKCLQFQPGLHEWEDLHCPKCSGQVARFSVEGMTCVADCRKEIANVKREFDAACPNHASSNSRVTLMHSQTV